MFRHVCHRTGIEKHPFELKQMGIWFVFLGDSYFNFLSLRCCAFFPQVSHSEKSSFESTKVWTSQRLFGTWTRCSKSYTSFRFPPLLLWTATSFLNAHYLSISIFWYVKRQSAAFLFHFSLGINSHNTVLSKIGCCWVVVWFILWHPMLYHPHNYIPYTMKLFWKKLTAHFIHIIH